MAAPSEVGAFIVVAIRRSLVGTRQYAEYMQPSYAKATEGAILRGSLCFLDGCAIRSCGAAKDGGMDGTRTRDLLRDRQTL